MARSCVLTLSAACLAVLAALPARAHEGPPFPIVVDRTVGPFLVSVWTDPDIGIGTFYVILEPVTGDDTMPEDVAVRVAVQPVSGRLPEASYDARREAARGSARYFAEVEFDQGEWWDVRVVVESAKGGGEVTARVEATPDGVIGPIGLVVFALPFLAVGFLWVRAAMARRGAQGA